MFLNDIGTIPHTTLKKINQHLTINYGFKLSEDMKDQDLLVITERIKDEITELKIKGDDAKSSAEISKRLLVLEGIKQLKEYAMAQFQSSELEPVIAKMTGAIVNSFRIAGTSSADFDEALKDAMKWYRSSEYRFPDDYIEQRVRHAALDKINSSSSADKATNDSESTEETILVSEDDEFSREEFMRKRKELQRIQLNPQSAKDPTVRQQLAKQVAQLNQRAMAAGYISEEDLEDGTDWGHIGKRDGPNSGYAPIDVDDTRGSSIPKLGIDPRTVDNRDNSLPMVRDRTGRMVQDPFAANAAARKKGVVHEDDELEGTNMRENKNLVKHLRALLETEVSQAEVMMAAKGFAQELQEMVEKIGRLQNEDLPPVTDQMRETYGMESASAFQTQIYGALQSVMDSLYTAKGQVDDAVSNMAATGQVSAAVDMDKEIDGMAADAGMDDGSGLDAGMDDGSDLDLDNLADEPADEFGGAEGEEPLGRSMKTESTLTRKVLEMQKLVAKARKLRESRK